MVRKLKGLKKSKAHVASTAISTMNLLTKKKHAQVLEEEEDEEEGEEGDDLASENSQDGAGGQQAEDEDDERSIREVTLEDIRRYVICFPFFKQEGDADGLV